MKILLTGANGQLGYELKKLAAKTTHQWFLTDVQELDITSEKQVLEFFHNEKPDVVINAAAYTAVDKAETEKELAYKINVEGVKNLAEACIQTDCRLIHISTDYVYGGNSFKPYKEEDDVNPQGYYGHTKLLGEQALLKAKAKGAIIRTSWLYGINGHNFVKAILNRALQQKELRVVYDQVGSPTWTGDLAITILKMIESQAFHQLNNTEIFNFSNEGAVSWYDFAMQITQYCNISIKITPILSEEYPTPAKRPHYSVMDKTKIKRFLNIEIPWWSESLNRFIAENKEKLIQL